MKSNEDFRNALGQPDEYFEQAVLETLDQLNRQTKKESRPQRSYIPRIACTFAALVLVIAGVVLSARQAADGRVDNIRPTPASAPEDRPDTFSFMETDLATISLQKAETDGFGIFLSFEVVPKQENVLVIGSDYNPVFCAPEAIGLTSDRKDQNVVQWAAEHGCELMEVYINTPPGGTAGDANCQSCNTSVGLGKTVIMNAYGCYIPNVDVYGMYLGSVIWDLSDPGIYGEDYDQATRSQPGSWINVFVTGEKETPEILAEYHLDSEREPDIPDTDITVTCIRTSRAKYMEVHTEAPADNEGLYWMTSPDVFYRIDSFNTPIHGYVRQEDGTVLVRETITLIEGFPDSFRLSPISYSYITGETKQGTSYLMKRVK